MKNICNEEVLACAEEIRRNTICGCDRGFLEELVRFLRTGENPGCLDDANIANDEDEFENEDECEYDALYWITKLHSTLRAICADGYDITGFGLTVTSFYTLCFYNPNKLEMFDVVTYEFSLENVDGVGFGYMDIEHCDHTASSIKDAIAGYDEWVKHGHSLGWF